MDSSGELLALRLALIAIIFGFILVAAFTMRVGLRGEPRRARVVAAGAARLLVVGPGETGLVTGDAFELAGEMTIGRDPAAGIVLADTSVSATHAVIWRANDGWRIRDNDSTNGTFVGARPAGARGLLLRGGEQLTLGSVVLRFSAG